MIKGEKFCRIAKEHGAHIALFPEMWNNGYNLLEPSPENKEILLSMAVEEESEFLVHYRKLSEELHMAAGLTCLEKRNGSLMNSFFLIDRKGHILFTYSKIHVCEFSREAVLTHGEDFYVAPLDTGEGEVNIGAMICFDREFPESARILMLKGAEIILVPNACEMEIHRISQLRTRAFENMVGVALTNYASPGNNGHSIAFSPICFDEEEKSVDNLIIEAGEDEGVYMAVFDMEKIRSYRKREVWGNKYRKHDKYFYIAQDSAGLSKNFLNL